MQLILILPKNSFLDEDNFVPPLGLLYVAAALKPFFKLIKILSWEEGLRYSFEKEDVLGFGGSSIHEEQFQELGKRFPGIFKIAGGPLPSIRPEKIQNYGFDLVVMREIEGIVDLVMEKILKREKGIIQGHSNFNLDDISTIDFSLVENKFNFHERIPIMTSRGCPYKCAFCAKIIDKIRLRNTVNLRKEIEVLKEKYNPKMFIFYDDNILMNKSRFIQLCKELQKVKIAWRSQARSDYVDDTVIKYALDSGCQYLSFGIESGSQKILNTINKSNSVNTNTKAISICKKLGLKTKVFLMIGLPGETVDTLRATKKWVLETQPDKVSLYIFHPFPGCDIYENIQRYDIQIVNKQVNYYAGKKSFSPCIIKTSHLTSIELQWAREDMVKLFQKNDIIVY